MTFLKDPDFSVRNLKNNLKMEHTEILLDISNSCRLCLKNSSNIRSIFSKEFAEVDISEQIFECTNLKVLFPIYFFFVVLLKFIRTPFVNKSNFKGHKARRCNRCMFRMFKGTSINYKI